MTNKYTYTLVQNSPKRAGKQEYRTWVWVTGKHPDYRKDHEMIVLQTNRKPEPKPVVHIEDYLSKLEETEIIDAGFVEGSEFHQILQDHGKIMSEELLIKLGITGVKDTEEYKKKKERLKTLKTLNRRTWDISFSPPSSMKQDPRFNPKHYPELY